MKDAKIEAASAEARLRAMAVAAGLATEEQAEKWIVVKVGELGKGSFANVDLPLVCEDCGAEHGEDDWTPLEVAIHMEMPEKARNTLLFLMNTPSNTTIN